MKFSFLGRKVMMVLRKISWLVSFFSLFSENLIDGGAMYPLSQFGFFISK